MRSMKVRKRLKMWMRLKKTIKRESIEQTLNQPPRPYAQELKGRISQRGNLRSKINLKKQKTAGNCFNTFK